MQDGEAGRNRPLRRTQLDSELSVIPLSACSRGNGSLSFVVSAEMTGRLKKAFPTFCRIKTS